MLRLTLSLAFFLGAAVPAAALEVREGDVVIRTDRLIDGTGAPGRAAMVVVRGDRIVAVEPGDENVPSTATVIDAWGRVVAPGFIDTHAHGDPVETPEMENFLAMGVTTICLGQDGGSVRVAEMADWFDAVAAAGPGPNVATYVGHGTVREEAGVGLSTTPTAGDIARMVGLVERALDAGAWGLTTGLEYQPGTFAAEDELAAVARPVGERGLVVMSHLRTEDDDQLAGAIRELIAQCRAAGARAHVSHIKSVYGKGAERAEEILAVIEEGRASGVPVTADIYPYTASYTGLGILFPDFALPPNDYRRVMEEQRAELLDYLDRRIRKRNGPEATLFATGPDAGKTLAQVAEEQGLSPAEVLMKKSPGGGSAAYFIMDEALQERLLVAEGVNVCSDGSPSMRHPRGHGTFARVIRHFVREQGALTLEEAIHKMSGLAAETTGLAGAGRGTLAAGNFADILIFDPEAVNDPANFSDPYQLAEGFDWIMVNGQVVREGAKFSGERAGRVLRRGKNF
ncbi:MAG: amidohydrolase family protein [Sumerlaeia bacterium]